MLDYHIATCLIQIATPLPKDRCQNLTIAIAHFHTFISRCEDYTLSPTSRSRTPVDAAAFRAQQIADFKREKATRARIADLHERIARITATSGGGQDDDDDDDVEAVERELTLEEIALSLGTAVQDVSIARDEIKILENIPEPVVQETGKENSDDSRLDMKMPTAHSGPLISADGKPLRPFVITSSKRQEILDGVFRPGHNLPTMSLDEYLDAEFEKGNIISGGGAQPVVEPVELTEEAEEAAMYKARNWDDYKDDNPRGWGNKGFNRG